MRGIGIPTCTLGIVHLKLKNAKFFVQTYTTWPPRMLGLDKGTPYE
jgi:hypothetical protein